MAENKEETKGKPKADPTELLLAEVEVREKDPSKPHRTQTAGEVVFNRVVYTGIGLGVNEASALVISDEFQHGIGKKAFNRISDWMVKALSFKDTVKNGRMVTAHANASNMLLWGSLLISGTLLVYPMKKLEDNKGYWVRKINHWIDKFRGNKITDDFVRDLDGKQLTDQQVTRQDIVAARDKEVEEALACEAKQTWPSLIIGRGIAVGTALGLGWGIGHENSGKMMNWSEKLLTGSVQEKKNRTHRYAALAALETLSCTTTSIALEIASKVFAKRGLTVRDPETCTDVVHRKNGTNGNGNGTNGGSEKPEDNGHRAVAKTAPPADDDALQKYKKKAILPSESHMDQVKSGETSFSLAP